MHITFGLFQNTNDSKTLQLSNNNIIITVIENCTSYIGNTNVFCKTLLFRSIKFLTPTVDKKIEITKKTNDFVIYFHNIYIHIQY